MRKNLYFFLAFISLLAVTYGIEKVLVSDGKQIQEQREKLFDVSQYGELMAIRTSTYSLLKQNGRFIVEDQNFPADKLIMRKVFDLIGSIKSVRLLPTEEVEKHYDQFFPNDNKRLVFEFEKGQLDCLIGAKVLYSRSFYLKIIKEEEPIYVIAKVDQPIQGVHSEEEEARSSYHYDQLISMITAKPELFFDRQVLLTNIKKVKDIIFVDDAIFIAVDKMSMIPRPYDGISVARKSVNAFLDDLAHIYAVRVFPTADVTKLGTPLRVIKIETVEHQVMLKLYRKFSSQVGWFLWNERRKVLYEITREVSRLFFQRAQNFWDKRVLKNSPEKMTVFDEGLSYPLVFQGGWKLDMTNGREVKQEMIKNLLEVLVKPADQLEQFVPSMNLDLYKQIFRFTIANRDILLMESKGDLVVWDKRANLLYHYWVGQNLPFDSHFINYLY